MKHLQRLTLAFALTFAIAGFALAGETSAPPCSPSETNGPPCPSASVTSDSSGTPGEQNGPPAAESQFSFSDLALDVVEGGLLLF